jgi:hypothetical protein
MKRIFFAFVMLSLLIISGCSGITGRGVTEDDINPKVQECAMLCDDGNHAEGYFLESCKNIFEYSDEETFSEYIEACKKSSSV